MKKLIAVTGTLIILVTAFSAQARSLHPLTFVLSGSLTEAMNIDQDSYLNNMEIFGGRVIVKKVRRELVLELNHAPSCEVGMACPEILLTHAISLKITSEVTDSCGSLSYIAERDLRPVDGAMERLVITDHTNNKCMTFIALPGTSISFETSFYDRINGEEVSTRSTFEASKLVSRIAPTRDLEKVLPALK